MMPDDWSVVVVLTVMVVVAFVLVAGYYLLRLLRSFRLVRNELMPLGGKVAFWAALLYVFSPIDVLPDPVMLDDAAVLIAAVTYIGRLARSVGLGPGTDADRSSAPTEERP